VVGQDSVGHRGSEPIQVRSAHGVLEPRQRGLRPQGGAVERIALEQHLVDRVVDQPGGIVAVGVATGQPEDTLPHQIPERVRDLAGLAPIANGAGQAPGQPELIVGQLQQQGAAVGAGVGLVEPGDDRLGNSVDLQRALRYRLWPSSLLGVV
jgi:hypothetical protein